MKRRFWGGLWSYRELFLVLAWRDVSVRYKQTLIGVVWAVLRPLFTIVVLTVIFGGLAGLPGEIGVPYALVVFAGVLSWSLFSSAIADASNSLVGNSHLISKVYFPLTIVPASAIAVSLIDYLISLLILPGLMAWFRFSFRMAGSVASNLCFHGGVSGNRSGSSARITHCAVS